MKKNEDDESVDIDEQTVENLVEQKLTEKQYNQVLSEAASSDDERELIEYHLENTVKSSGDPKEDVERAKLLANKDKIKENNKELAEMAKANSSKNGPQFSSSKKMSSKDKEPNLTPREKEWRQNFRDSFSNILNN